MPVHLVGAGPVADVADRHAGLRKDGGEQVAVSVSVVPRDPWAGAALRPDPCQHALLPDSRLVLETQVDAGQIDALRQGRCHQSLEILAKVLLPLLIGLGMDRSRRQLPEAQRVHQGADRLHRQRHLENLRAQLFHSHLLIRF